MFLQQGILDQSFGVSGERFLTNSSSSIGKLFKYDPHLYTIFSQNKDIIINNIDLSQNVKIYTHISQIIINDIFIDTNKLYFCGKDVSTNIGVYGISQLDISFNINIYNVDDVLECNHIYIRDGDIHVISTDVNYQIILHVFGYIVQIT